MMLEDFRERMDAFWASANREAHELKDSVHALERLSGLYHRLDGRERELADRVIAEWALNDDEAKRFDAVALIRQFQIASAEPELRELMAMLDRSDDPGAPFEREKSKRCCETSASTERLRHEWAGELVASLLLVALALVTSLLLTPSSSMASSETPAAKASATEGARAGTYGYDLHAASTTFTTNLRTGTQVGRSGPRTSP